MPVPIPMDTETMKEYMDRMMSDKKMMEEYPDEKQRYAIAQSMWEKKDAYKSNNDIDDKYVMFSKFTIEPTEQQQLIKVFPRGKHYVSKYDKTINFDDKFYDDIIVAFSSESLSKPKIDKDHEFKTSYGDIEGYEIKDDGMYFKIKLNSKGVELVKNREYNYVSPAWGRTTDTERKEYPNRLLAVSLVNFPALEGMLPSLQDQLKLSKFEIVSEKKKKEAKKMELYVLAKELGLNSEASIDAIHDEVLKLKTSLSGKETVINELKTKHEKAENTVIELGKKLLDIEKETLKKEGFEAVRKWVELGKIHPAVQDNWIERYCLNKESTVKEMEMIPEKVYSGQKSANTNTSGIDPEIEAKMLKAGLDPKDKEDVTIALSRWGGK